jgi:hypothetical protein
MSNAGGFKSLNRYYDMLAGNAAYVPIFGAYDSIATTTVGSGGSSSVTFSSIPATYTHLQIRVLARDSRANVATNLVIRFNGDTAANYADHVLYGNATSAVAGADVSQTSTVAMRAAGNNAAANSFGAGVIDILDYANTSKYKTMRSLSGFEDNSDGQIWLMSGLWMSTSAVTSINIAPTTSPILQYSSFALYGIKGA